MIGWLHKLNDDSRRTSLNQASIKSGITPKAIEKDFSPPPQNPLYLIFIPIFHLCLASENLYW